MNNTAEKQKTAEKVIFVGKKTNTNEEMEIANKTAEALKLKVPAFADAEVVLGFADARTKLEGNMVLSTWLPLNLAAIADTYIEATHDIDDDIVSMITAEKLASKIHFINIFKAQGVDFKKFYKEHLAE